MSAPGPTIRRATLDDLETLRGLWRECRLPEYDLEKRFTEFQVAVDEQGWILGAIGLRFAGHQGQVHSLAIRRGDLEASLTAQLWERLLAISHQHGAYRLWTRDHGPFWTEAGFGPATPAEHTELPPLFGDGTHWLTLKLRNEPLKLIAAEEQLEAYLEMERLKTERLLRRGQVLKFAATAFAGLLFVGALGTLFFVVLRNRRNPPRRPPQP